MYLVLIAFVLIFHFGGEYSSTDIERAQYKLDRQKHIDTCNDYGRTQDEDCQDKYGG